MFSIAIVTNLDNSLYQQVQNIYENEYWCIDFNGDDYVLYPATRNIVYMFETLADALDFFEDETSYVDNVVVFSRVQDIHEAVRHKLFIGLVEMTRIIKEETTIIIKHQQPTEKDTIVHLASLGFHPCYIGNVEQIGSFHIIDSNWKLNHDPSEIEWGEEDEDDVTNIPYHEEFQYLRLCRKILATGLYTAPENERTGTGTLSVYGEQMKFSLRNNQIPVCTTKKLFWKGVVAETLMMMRGSTNTKELEAQNVNIWKGNTSRDFLDKRGLKHLPEGDIGSSYGVVLRHWGAKYVDCNTDYTGQGHDQLAHLVHEIKSNPSSRRLVISLWNVEQLDGGALTPCAFTCTFRVLQNELYCSLKIRSSDNECGKFWNIAQYALITYIIADLTNLKPGELTITSDDSHIYLSHIDAMITQLSRSPYPFPKLYIQTHRTDLNSWQKEDFLLVDYQHHPSIKVEMAI